VTYEREFGPGVDLDLLADYIGGALDGTPEEATVERRIADDPAWARAYAESSAAIEAVRVDLSALGAAHEEMPPEVVGRLEAALASVPPEETGKVVELAPRQARARRARWAKRLAPVAVAAGVLISVALGASLLRDSASDSGAAGTSSAGDQAAAPAAASPQFSGGPPLSSGEAGPPAAGKSAPRATRGEAESADAFSRREDAATVPPVVVASGTDYTRDTLPVVASRSGTGAQSGQAQSGTSAEPPAQLSGLKDPAALNTCLTAIRLLLDEPDAPVRLVDLARFEGSPAVVVLLTDRIWVSGPRCGQIGADTLFTTRTQGR
jgi:hypothetical protein